MGIYLDVGVTSDVGDRRKKNEDSVLIKTCFIGDREIGLFAVADGMGGLKNGKEASSFTIDVLDFWWEHYFIDMLVEKNTIAQIAKSLDDSIRLINLQLTRNIEKSGTTLSFLLLIGDIYILRNIGDSRIYLLNKKFTKLTIDHSYIEEMAKKGASLKEDKIKLSKRNLITNCLGVTTNLNIFEKIDKVEIGDVFLLCSDGFYNEVSEPDIMKILFNRRIFTMQDKAKELRNAIKKGEASDNVSIILVTQTK